MITVIGNLKGGSGKSTVTFNLALWLMSHGKSVVVYDLDPQATLSDVALVRKEEKHQPPLKVYARYVKPHFKEPVENYETLIDVGAANMEAMRRAISLSDRVIIPVSPSQADIWSTQRFLLIIAGETRPDKKPPEVFAFVNRADTHAVVKETDQAEEALRTLPGIHVLNMRLCSRTIYRRSFSEGLAVFEIEPSGKAAKEFEIFARHCYPL
jgi:chromosome partitioning protein